MSCPIVRRLIESRNLNESYVGAFYIIGDKILSNAVKVNQGDSYGDFVNYSSHWDLWRVLCRIYPNLKRYEYDDFPRGRVVYNKVSRKFIVYLDPKLNNRAAIDKVCREYRLGSSNYIINDKDEHYKSLRMGNTIKLTDNVSINESLSNYIDLDIIYK